MESGDIYFSHAHFPVTALGYGRRVGVWLQGCSIHCPGCIVPQSWRADESHRATIARLVRQLEPWLRRADGLTISGGEPFDQPEALETLIRLCRPILSGDILIYSGHPWKHVSRFERLLGLVDAVIPEPFRAQEPSIDSLTGSANQPVLLLTDMARARYGHCSPLWSHFDTAPAPGLIRMAGVPRTGEFSAIARAVCADGPQS